MSSSKQIKSKNSKSAAASSTVLDKVVHAIRELKGGPKGSSRAAITKFLKAELEYDNPTALKKAFKKGVENKTLTQTGQSFRVSSDPVEQGEDDEESKLQIKDIKMGGGKQDGDDDRAVVACPGDSVTVAYVGTLDDENGYEFDRSKSFTFLLGGGEVIKGWDVGVEGMKLGGKRTLVVPPKLGYGKRGCKPDIPGNATLHFTVTLKRIEKQS